MCYLLLLLLLLFCAIMGVPVGVGVVVVVGGINNKPRCRCCRWYLFNTETGSKWMAGIVADKAFVWLCVWWWSI